MALQERIYGRLRLFCRGQPTVGAPYVRVTVNILRDIAIMLTTVHYYDDMMTEE
jgi:hypothetical protein